MVLEKLWSAISKAPPATPEENYLRKSEMKLLENAWASTSKKISVALSEMISRNVNVTSSSLKVMLINEVPRLLNPQDVSTTVITVKITGNINGAILTAAPLSDILKLASVFLHLERGYFNSLSESNLPVIREFASVLSGYYVTALNDLFKTKYAITNPEVSVNPFRAIEDMDFGRIYVEKIYVLFLETSLHIENEDVKVKTLVLFKKKDIEKILRALVVQAIDLKADAKTPDA